MMETSVVYASLERLAGNLCATAEDLVECGGSAPENVDAGEVSAAILHMIATAIDAAAGLAEGLAATGEALQACVANYVAEDDLAAEAFRRIGAPR